MSDRMLRYEVEWTDSGTIHTGGWEKASDVLRTLRIGTAITVGILMHETDDTLFLALSYDPEHENYYGVQAIQKSAIVRRSILRAR